MKYYVSLLLIIDTVYSFVFTPKLTRSTYSFSSNPLKCKFDSSDYLNNLNSINKTISYDKTKIFLYSEDFKKNMIDNFNLYEDYSNYLNYASKNNLNMSYNEFLEKKKENSAFYPKRILNIRYDDIVLILNNIKKIYYPSNQDRIVIEIDNKVRFAFFTKSKLIFKKVYKLLLLSPNLDRISIFSDLNMMNRSGSEFYCYESEENNSKEDEIANNDPDNDIGDFKI